MNKAEYENQVERAFTAYANATRQPFSAESKARLRERYRVYGGDEDALVDLKNVLEGARVVHEEHAKSAEVLVTKKRGKSQKCFDRRYHIVAFVTQRLPKSNRPDWKRIVAEWNSVHPLDQASRDLLRVEYNRALREWDIVFQYLVATRDDRPFREMIKRAKGPTERVAVDEATEWLKKYGGNFITVIEKTTILKDEEAR